MTPEPRKRTYSWSRNLRPRQKLIAEAEAILPRCEACGKPARRRFRLHYKKEAVKQAMCYGCKEIALGLMRAGTWPFKATDCEAKT